MDIATTMLCIACASSVALYFWLVVLLCRLIRMVNDLDIVSVFHDRRISDLEVKTERQNPEQGDFRGESMKRGI